MEQGLTRREAEAIITTAEAGGNKIAAEMMGISVQTLKNLLWEVRKATDASTTLQAYHRMVRGVRFITETTQRFEIEE